MFFKMIYLFLRVFFRFLSLWRQRGFHGSLRVWSPWKRRASTATAHPTNVELAITNLHIHQTDASFYWPSVYHFQFSYYGSIRVITLVVATLLRRKSVNCAFLNGESWSFIYPELTGSVCLVIHSAGGGRRL